MGEYENELKKEMMTLLRIKADLKENHYDIKYNLRCCSWIQLVIREN